jgi:hypothetical protein
MSGFADAIGRWFRSRIDGSMPAQKGGGWCRGQVQAFKDYAASGLVADAPLSLPRREIFEGMVGFDNLCRIAAAADNFEETMVELQAAGRQFGIVCEDDDADSAALWAGALNELIDALQPYRTARDMAQCAMRKS